MAKRRCLRHRRVGLHYRHLRRPGLLVQLVGVQRLKRRERADEALQLRLARECQEALVNRSARVEISGRRPWHMSSERARRGPWHMILFHAERAGSVNWLFQISR